jgi:hypothetical protein
MSRKLNHLSLGMNSALYHCHSSIDLYHKVVDSLFSAELFLSMLDIDDSRHAGILDKLTGFKFQWGTSMEFKIIKRKIQKNQNLVAEIKAGTANAAARKELLDFLLICYAASKFSALSLEDMSRKAERLTGQLIAICERCGPGQPAQPATRVQH